MTAATPTARLLRRERFVVASGLALIAAFNVGMVPPAL